MRGIYTLHTASERVFGDRVYGMWRGLVCAVLSAENCFCRKSKLFFLMIKLCSLVFCGYENYKIYYRYKMYKINV